MQKLEKNVEQLDDSGNILHTFKSIKDAKLYMQDNYNMNNPAISSVCNNLSKYKTAGGFYWRFKKIDNKI